MLGALNPWVLLGVVAAMAGSFGAGWEVRAWKADADQLAQRQADARDAQRRVDNADRASGDYEATKAQRQEKQRVVTKEVDRIVTVYRDRACLDDDGLRVLSEAIGGNDSGQPAPVLPAASGSR